MIISLPPFCVLLCVLWAITLSALKGLGCGEARAKSLRLFAASR